MLLVGLVCEKLKLHTYCREFWGKNKETDEAENPKGQVTVWADQRRCVKIIFYLTTETVGVGGLKKSVQVLFFSAIVKLSSFQATSSMSLSCKADCSLAPGR